MVTNSSKKEEVAGRGRQIVNAAFMLLEREGLSAVRLDRVAELIGCTRTTLYNHFANREEMLIEMAAQAVSCRHRLFEAAVRQEGPSRHRIMAVCVASMVYFDELPTRFAIEQAIEHESIWEKVAPERQAKMLEDQNACMELCASCVLDGIRDGELPLPSGLTVEQMVERVCFGLWSMAYGGLVIEASSPSLERVGIRDVRSTIHHNCNALLDSFDWQPAYEPIAYQAFLSESLNGLRAVASDLLKNSTPEVQAKQSTSERETHHDAS